MQMFQVLLVFALVAAPRAWGSPTVGPWNCTMEADLVGNADFYLRYGRDSWQGKAFLTCESEVGQFNQYMDISFNSLLSGVGVNEGSKIHVALQMRTSVTPPNASIYVHVSNKELGPAVKWHTESESSQLDIQVTAEGMSNIQQSLQQGSLYIR